MPSRLVALDEGPDITLDRTIVVVGRHPACETRLDSLRVSRHHCCMTHENGEVVVRDLGSTNGIRINGQRVEMGRLRPGDELSIAHIRYRLENGQGHEQTIAEQVSVAGLPRPAVGEERGPSVSAREPKPRRLVSRVRMCSPPLFANCFRPGSPTSVRFKSSSKWPGIARRLRKMPMPWGSRTALRRTPPNVVPTRPTDQEDGPDH